MEAVGLVIATASIASICQTCLHGYRTLNVALGSSDCALTLGILFRVQECRLYLWGRNWGLIRQMQHITSFKQGEESAAIQQKDQGIDAQGNEAQPLDEIDTLLEIPGLRLLVMDMLARMHDVLEKWNRTMMRYTIPTTVRGAKQMATLSIAEVNKQQKDQVKKSSKATSFISKTLWAVKDKAQLEELLSTLVSINDGLENLLPSAEKENLQRGLAAEILTTIDDSDDTKSAIATNSNSTRDEDRDANDRKAARILSVRQQNSTETNENTRARRYEHQGRNRRSDWIRQGDQRSSGEDEDEDDFQDRDIQTKGPFSTNATKKVTSSWEIPRTDFQHLLEPQLEHYHAKTEHVDFFGPENYVPLPRSFCLYVPSKPFSDQTVDHNIPQAASHASSTSSNTGHVQDNLTMATDDRNISMQGSQSDKPTASVTDQDEETSEAENDNINTPPPIVVLIEWRLQKAESSRSQLSEQELCIRREHVVSLLHRTAVADDDFRVLDCLGFTLSAGFTPDGKQMPLVGFVYRYPLGATPNGLPVTLRTMLDEAYNSDALQVPSLEKRIQLAKALSIALYQLQCAGWIHRKISSYNILFFRDRTTGKIDISQPYLSGWQYSRPDDQYFQHLSEASGYGIGDLDMYVHPARLVARSGRIPFPRFRRSFDIYSLGVVLLEIAFWEPIFVLGSEKDREQMQDFGESNSGKRSKEWRARYIEVTKQEMAAEVGSTYRDVVLKCLEGLVVEVEGNDEQQGMPSTPFEEPGLEKDFFWDVVRPLNRIRL